MEIQTSLSWMKSVLNTHWKDWCWSRNSNTLATWCKELTYLKRPWCWERLKVGGEGDNRGWDGWMASSMDMSLSTLREIVKDREAWSAVVPGIEKSQTWLSDWRTRGTDPVSYETNCGRHCLGPYFIILWIFMSPPLDWVLQEGTPHFYNIQGLM